MSDKSKIEWTDATWNPVTGCTKVSQGCKHCYAERDWARLRHLPDYRRPFTSVRAHSERLLQPLRWTKPRRVFVNSMSDLFHEEVSFNFILRVFAVMALAQEHTFQILTKRPARMLKFLSMPGLAETIGDIESDFMQFRFSPRGKIAYRGPNRRLLPLPNVWLGVSVENQETANERIPLLLETPAAVRWLSCEPLLGPVSLDDIESPPGEFTNALSLEEWRGLEDSPEVKASIGGGALIDWVVAGGESGKDARPMHPGWARSLRDQCQAADVSFFFKQWGEWAPTVHEANKHAGPIASIEASAGSAYGDIAGTKFLVNGKWVMYPVYRAGKKNAGRLLDGREWNEYPEVRS